MRPHEDLVDAARVLSEHGLVDAFGHISARSSGNLVITPPKPLGLVTTEAELTTFALGTDDLPAGVPREAWIHTAIYARRPDVGAVCRAQPPMVTGVTAAGLTIGPLHGQGALLGEQVRVFDDARLVRDRAQGHQLAARLRNACAVVMRGNGAVTVGQDVGEATARMYVLEASARVNAIAAACGTPIRLRPEEFEAWDVVAPEILGRIWAYLRQS